MNDQNRIELILDCLSGPDQSNDQSFGEATGLDGSCLRRSSVESQCMDKGTLFRTIGDAVVFVDRDHVLEGRVDAKQQFRIGRSFENWMIGEPATHSESGSIIERAYQFNVPCNHN